jgi:hypothetical protein
MRLPLNEPLWDGGIWDVMPIMAGAGGNACGRWPGQPGLGPVAGNERNKHFADRCQRSAQALASACLLFSPGCATGMMRDRDPASRPDAALS